MSVLKPVTRGYAGLFPALCDLCCPIMLTAPKLLMISLLLCGLSCAYAGDDSADRGNLSKGEQVNNQETAYRIQAGLDGEIYPVFANYASLQKQAERGFGMVSVTVSNPGRAALHQRIAVKIAGWSDQEIQIADVVAGSTRTFIFAPAFLPRFYENHEIVAATVQISVTDLAGHSLYETTAPVRLRSAEDMYWGSDFKYAPFIASWVTPHDAKVEAVLTQAKKYTVDHRLPGYESWKDAGQQEQETWREAAAIYTAVKRMGMSYVKSSATLGDHQSVSERVRMPGSSLSRSSANCIDAAVMYASLFENLGMESSVVLVPGHAYAGVKVAAGSSKILLIDVALTGRSTFEHAVASAEAGVAKLRPNAITRIAVSQARSAGIYPMPQ